MHIGQRKNQLHCVETELSLVFFNANIMGDIYQATINNQVLPEMRERFQYNLFGEVCFEGRWWFQDGVGALRAQPFIVEIYKCMLHQNVWRV